MWGEHLKMRKNIIDDIPTLGQVLTSGPLYRWLSQQNSNCVTLSYAPNKAADSLFGTQPLHQLKWQMVLFFDDNKRARFAWKLEAGGNLSDTEVIGFMEEVFGDEEIARSAGAGAGRRTRAAPLLFSGYDHNPPHS
jgi:hypothetical protein